MAGMSITGKFAVIAVVCILVGTGVGYFVTLKTVPPKVEQTTSKTTNPVIMAASGSGDCPWQNDAPGVAWEPTHSNLISLCSMATGKVVMITMYVDNEQNAYHFTIQPDAKYSYLMNSVNNQTMENHGLDGCLMIELPKTQYSILPRLYVGQHLEVHGPWIQDKDNVWNEIHFVQSIKEIPA